MTPSARAARMEHRRHECWRVVRRYYIDRGWVHAYRKYEELIVDALEDRSVVLDLGCGRDFPLASFLLEAGAEVHGVDPVLDSDAISRLDGVTVKCGQAEAIPYPDDSFDLVMSRSVLEHLKRPLITFREIYRVLKPDGRFVFLTPSRYHYVSVAASLIPNRFHPKIVKLMEGRNESKTFPTFYQANSIRQITRLSAKSGFEVAGLNYENNYPSMFMSHPILCRVAVRCDQLIGEYPSLYFLRGWILGCLRSMKRCADRRCAKSCDANTETFGH